MAFFTLIRHPDPVRRARFTERSRRLASGIASLHIESFACGRMAGVVGVPHASLLDLDRSDTALHIKMGVMTGADGPMAADAAGAWLWANGDVATEYPGGFFLAASMRAEEPGGRTALRVAVDRWGLYPLYQSRLPDDTLLIASSPDFMRTEPAFSDQLDVTGLCGLMLINGLFENRSLTRRVVRLPAGRCWKVGDSNEPEVGPESPLPGRTGLHDASFEEAVSEIGRLWDHSLKRMDPGTPTCTLLSGGIDSRMLTAGLAHNGMTTTLVSYGKRGDYEVQAARSVARGMRMRWMRCPDFSDAEAFEEVAAWVAHWTGLAGGYSGRGLWTPPPPQWLKVHCVWVGIGLDNVIGGKGIGDMVRVASPEDARQLFAILNAWGLPPSVLADALRDRSARDIPYDMEQRLIQACPQPGVPVAAQVLFAKLKHRIRFHLGALMWQWSFHVWPLIPVLEPDMVAAGFTLPADILSERQLQLAYLHRYAPTLNTVPIDTNAHAYFAIVEDPWVRLRRHLSRWMSPGLDPRRYHRLYNMNHPDWQHLRRLVEPHRRRLDPLLDMEKLAAYWPAPEQPWPDADPFGAPASGRNLMALAWRQAFPTEA